MTRETPVDVMIDIETLSTEQSAVILTLGACAFDRYNTGLFAEKRPVFYKKLLYDAQIEDGRSMDIRTIRWWAAQFGTQAYDDAIGGGEDDASRVSLFSCLLHLSNWLEGAFPSVQSKDLKFWSHGSAFDLSILKHAMDSDMHLSFRNIQFLNDFRNWRDTRTMLDLCGEEIHKNPHTVHNALADAVAQAEAMERCFQKVLIKYETPASISGNSDNNG